MLPALVEPSKGENGHHSSNKVHNEEFYTVVAENQKWKKDDEVHRKHNPLLEKCENVEYVEMKDFDGCCGFAGEFALKNLKISKEISKQKALNAYETGADYILTTCPACIMGLHQGFLFSGKKAPKIMNIIEFLAEATLQNS